MKTLKLELTDHCNANCVFCNKRSSPGYMCLDMFKSIIDDFPEVKNVQPQWFGESSLHPFFYEALEYIKKKGKCIAFYTNGSLIDPVLLADLEPEIVIFSVEADNKLLYEGLRRGLTWEVLLEKVDEFQKRKSMNTKTTVRMTITNENRGRISQIKKYWSKRVDRVVVIEELPQGRLLKGEYQPRYNCSKANDIMVVASNGDVVLCCVDIHKRIIFGNVRDGARKIWEDTEFTNIRKGLMKGKMQAICKECGFGWQRIK